MTEDELALYLGKRVIADADKLRLFTPDCFARFPLEWCNRNFEIRIILKDNADDEPL